MKKVFLILIIVAVIALVAIFVIGPMLVLIPIQSQVMNLVKTDPNNETKTLLSETIDIPGRLNESKTVAFYEDTGFSTSGFSVRLPISKDQICLSLGEFADSPDFKLIKEGKTQRIEYLGEGVNTKLKVICNSNIEALQSDIISNSLEAGNTKENCETVSEYGSACLVYLAKP